MGNKEALSIVLHLVVTLALIIAYLTTLILGHPDAMLQGACLLSVGWWFGKNGGISLNKKKGTDDNEL